MERCIELLRAIWVVDDTASKSRRKAAYQRERANLRQARHQLNLNEARAALERCEQKNSAFQARIQRLEGEIERLRNAPPMIREVPVDVVREVEVIKEIEVEVHPRPSIMIAHLMGFLRECDYILRGNIWPEAESIFRPYIQCPKCKVQQSGSGFAVR
jgi:hypothetical protein